MFKQRTKSKPTHRTRPSSPEQDNEHATPTAIVKKFKDKTKRNKPKARLSFGGGEDEDEDGGDAFQVKKSKLSRKLTLGKHPANIPTNLDQATISTSRPTYDQAYLNELKSSTPSTRAPVASLDPYDADMSVDDISGTSIVETSDTIIPSESSIKLAKERRERIRASKASGNEDFISLSVTKSQEYQGPHPESRLMREEDELGEADDEYAEYTSAQERIALSKKSRKAEASKRREAMKEMIADANEEDEETAEWEQEQLRRGGHLGGESPSSSPKPAKRTYQPAPIPPVTPIPTLSSSLARLTQQMSQLTTSHANNTAALNTLAQEREQVDEREKEMRELVGKAEEKRAWFGSFREWVEGVAGFLDEKYPMLEKLEEEHLSLLKERFDMINNRRQQDDEDDLSTFLGPLPLALGNDTTMDETDELGRIIPKSDPVALRRQRRSARSVRHQERQMRQKEKLAEEEGYSTDSEIPPADEAAYRAAQRSIATRNRGVLSDVKAKEFLDPGKGQWSVWREKYADSYVGAWGGLGVVSVWEFWARLECVGWDCIEEPKSLDSFHWYQGLYDYSRPGDTNDATRELGPDGDLVSSMITTAIIPRLSKVIEGGALDVYSHSHIRRAIDLMEEIEASIEEGSPKLQVLAKSVVTCFERAIYETEKLLAKFTAAADTRSAPAFDPESVPSRQRFLTRRVKLLTNLLRWRKSTGERFGLGKLAARIVDGLVVEIADGGWEVGGADVVQTVAGMLPPDLVTNGIKTRLSSR